MRLYSILKLIIAIAVILPALYYMIKKQRTAPSLAISLVICLCVAAFLSNSACKLISPTPTERITITALEEKNELSDGYEVFLNDIYDKKSD